MTFKWIAELNDSTLITQFDNGDETPFLEVENNKAELKTFKIEADDGEYYSVDLQTGTIDCNGKIEKIDMNGKSDLELVYSRRNQIRMKLGNTGEILDSRIIHRVGLKSSDGDELIIEAFPGLEMVPKNVSAVKNRTVKTDITKDI